MTEWHIDPRDLTGYVAGQVGPIGLASIESHLVACAACREALAEAVHGTDARQPDTDRVWSGIANRVDSGPRAFVKSTRLLHVSIASKPLLLATFLLAGLLVAAVTLGGATAGAPGGTVILVYLGPLVPLLAARLALVEQADPAGQMAPAAPLGASRIAAMRALVAVTIASVAGIVVTPLTNLSASGIAAWLLPALAASSVAVALATFVDSTLPTGLFAVLWLAATAAWLGGEPRGRWGTSLDGLVTARPVVQVGLVLVVCAAALSTFATRDHRRAGWSL